MRFLQLIGLCVAALLGARMVDARPHLYDHLERSDITLASAYINNEPADETIAKRDPGTEDNEELHHRIDITDREYLESRNHAQQKRKSHYKFRIGNGKPVRRGLVRQAEEDSEDEMLPAAALPIRRSPLGMRVLTRAQYQA